MRSTTRALAATSLLALLTGTALAADLSPPAPVYTAEANQSRFYVGSVSAANFLERTTFRLNGAAVRSDYDVDSYFAGRIGYGLGRVYGVVLPRVEIEGGYARNDVNRQTVNATRVAPIDSYGSTRSIQGYGNLFFDLDLGYAVRPFIGGGIGVADVRLRRQGTSATGVLVDSSDTGLSYHYGAGLGVDLGKLGFPLGATLFQGTVMELGYRRTETPDLRFQARDGTTSKTDYKADMVTLGARKSF